MGTWRRAYGALKDSTRVGLAKVSSEFKELDIAIVKATNHEECPPKERHVRKIFTATSVARPRADIAYCIYALAKRLAKTRNWVAGGFDKLLLDSLYEDASRRQQIAGGTYIDSLNANSFDSRNPFDMSGGFATPTNVQMTLMEQEQQQQYYYQQQQMYYQQLQKQQFYYQQQQMSQHYQQQHQQHQQPQQMTMVPYGCQTQNHHLHVGQTNPFSVSFSEYSQSTPSHGNSSLI